jgi:peptide-methionine (S)-S-oxide reductase
VGYTGGTKANPTYHSLGDHSESIQIDYDPRVISYEELLKRFWAGHDPGARSWSTQYKAAVFYHNDQQRKLAEETRDRIEAAQKIKVQTEILPFSRFYVAEAYHQKYGLRWHSEFMREFRSIYPSDEAFMNSTAAARVNGYLSGFGSSAALREEIDSFGLSPEAERRLLELVKKNGR